MEDLTWKEMDIPTINHCTNYCPNCGRYLTPDLLDKEADEEMMIIYNCKCGCRFHVDMNDYNCETIIVIRSGVKIEHKGVTFKSLLQRLFGRNYLGGFLLIGIILLIIYC